MKKALVTRRPGRPKDSATLYRRIAAELRAQIEAGAFAGGKLLPSLRRVAAQHGVGKRTATLAVDALKQDGWVAATVGGRLTARQPKNSLNVDGNLILELSTEPLADAMGNQDFVDLQTGMTTGAGKLNAPLLIIHDRELQRRLPSRLAQLSPRGILLYGRFLPAVLKRYEKLRLPIVWCDTPGENWALHSVSVDNRQGARDTVLRLAKMGHTRIAFVQYVHYTTGKIDPDSIERQIGFLRGMKEAGLRVGRDCIYNSFPSDTSESAPIRRLLEAKPAFTAVLTVEASIADRIAQAAKRLGRKVPRDLYLAAFQGLRAKYPEIPGPRVDFEEIGRRAGLLLSAPARPVQHIKVPTQWTSD